MIDSTFMEMYSGQIIILHKRWAIDPKNCPIYIIVNSVLLNSYKVQSIILSGEISEMENLFNKKFKE